MLILAAVTLMCGCALTILAEGNADGIPDAATEIAQIDKYGNIDLSISPEALRELGYEPGDIIQVKIGISSSIREPTSGRITHS